MTAGTSPSASPQLQGRWLILARAAWLVAVCLALATHIGLGPMRLQQLHGLAADNAEGLAALGLSQDFLIPYLGSLDLLLTSVFAVGGIVIFLRRSDNWLTILVSVGPDPAGRVSDASGGFLRPRHAGMAHGSRIAVTCLATVDLDHRARAHPRRTLRAALHALAGDLLGGVQRGALLLLSAVRPPRRTAGRRRHRRRDRGCRFSSCFSPSAASSPAASPRCSATGGSTTRRSASR